MILLLTFFVPSHGTALQDESIRWYFDRAVFKIQSILKFEFSKMSVILKIGISKMCKILVEDKKILSLSFSIRLCVGVVWELIEPYKTRRIGSTGQIFNIRHFGFSLFCLEFFVIFCFSDFWFFD